MKNKIAILLLSLFLTSHVYTQYWQQKVDYTIDVFLNEKENTINGFEKVLYKNNAPDTLHFILFHIWPNAYKNVQTAYSKQTVNAGNTAFYFSKKEQKGYIKNLDFKVNETTAITQAHSQYADVIKVILPQPLLPGDSVLITTPFLVKLPFAFSRSGYYKNAFQITQWYPKPAVYDAEGWHEMPYLDQGEFYGEFGNFNVSINVPKHFVVAASGVLQNSEERKRIIENAKKRYKHSADQKPVKTTKGFKKVEQEKKDTALERKTLRYILNDAHDFAFFADPNFIVRYDTCALTSGKIIEVFTYFHPEEEKWWNKSIGYSKDALRFYSEEVGEYPYPLVSVVQGAKSIGGGMEYPTIAVISPTQTDELLDAVIAHEIGHNWFYGMLASNERAAPWMDEGFNSFYEYKYTKQKYGQKHLLEEMLLKTAVKQKTDQPIATAAHEFSTTNYALIAYHKTAKWLQLIEDEVGKAAFKTLMQTYFTNWKFKHPSAGNFKSVAHNLLGTKTDSIFSLLYKKGTLSNNRKEKMKIASPFAPITLQNYVDNPTKNLLFITPIPGYNHYDKLMGGVLFSNYTLPPTAFQFIALPMYAFNSKKINSITKLTYSIYPDAHLQQIKFGISTLNFSKNSSLDTNYKKKFESFYRITPSIRFTFKELPKENKEKFIEAKSFFIGEKNFSHFVQKTGDEKLYVDSFMFNRYNINQLAFTNYNYRVINPFNYTLGIQQGKGFYKLQLTGEYFYNYNEKGGLKVRVFGAKYGHLNVGNSHPDQILKPQLLGITGEEDDTYSNYFLGRTASTAYDKQPIANKGIAAQQIMIRDGGMKIRFDQFSFLQGRSNSWLAAINLNSTLPQRLLPSYIPMRLFFDIGTFAGVDNNQYNKNRLIWVGGLQFSVLKDIVNFYFPIFYCKQIKDHLKTIPDENTFFKRMTFSMDLHRINLRHPTIGKFFL